MLQRDQNSNKETKASLTAPCNKTSERISVKNPEMLTTFCRIINSSLVLIKLKKRYYLSTNCSPAFNYIPSPEIEP
jgi:hypothetical protein